MESQQIVGWTLMFIGILSGLWVLSLPLRLAFHLRKRMIRRSHRQRRVRGYSGWNGSEFYRALYPSGRGTHDDSRRAWEQSWDLD